LALKRKTGMAGADLFGILRSARRDGRVGGERPNQSFGRGRRGLVQIAAPALIFKALDYNARI
jgi:hypothetical protein